MTKKRMILIYIAIVISVLLIVSIYCYGSLAVFYSPRLIFDWCIRFIIPITFGYFVALIYVRTFILIQEVERSLGIKITVFYYLDKFLSLLLLLVSCSVLLWCLGLLLLGPIVILAMYLPGWWVYLLCLAFIPVLLLQNRRLKKLRAQG